MKNVLISSLLTALFFGCQAADDKILPETKDTEVITTPASKEMTLADKLLAKSFTAHGGELYTTANYRFVFRDKSYTFKNDGTSSVYTRTADKDGVVTKDVLDNGNLTRTIDGQPVELSEKDQAKYGESVNSVIYFATLPHKLLDPAVNLELVGTTAIKGQQYDQLKINFDAEGGGTDHDDNFLYWINQKTGHIDYLAYDYKTSGGGVRFRSAYNPRVVGGILFQDYINFKAEIGTTLVDLAELYEAGKLKELSRIETEGVEVVL